MKPIFVTGIDTGIGKTHVSAMLVKSLEADYWKPIQCGDLENSDSKKISKILSGNFKGKIHPERYRFEAAVSPHLAAKNENTTIRTRDFTLPATERYLVIEGAGGVLVPINEQDYIIDLAAKFDSPVVLVCQNYLGSLNHTLTSAEAIFSRGLKLMGLVFNGKKDEESETFLCRRLNTSKLFHMPWLEDEILPNQQVQEVTHALS